MFRVRRSAPATCIMLSTLFVDHYMPAASGEYIKIYLYLLRHLECPDAPEGDVLSLSAISDALDLTEKNIKRGLHYWEKQGLLSVFAPDGNEIQTLTLCAPSVLPSEVIPDQAAGQYTSAGTAAAQADDAAMVPSGQPSEAAPPSTGQDTDKPNDVAAAPAVGGSRERPHYSLDQLDAFSRDEAVQELFFVTQTYLKKQLTSTEQDYILFWYDQLGFSTDLIVYLVEYCLTKGHSGIRYMHKVALAWSDEKITSVARAKEETASHSKIYYAVMKSLGITGRSLVPAENEFISKWTSDYGYDQEMIEEACRRTILSIHAPSFEYTDSILSNWFQNRVCSLADVKKLDRQHEEGKKKGNSASAPGRKAAGRQTASGGNSFNQFSQRSYDDRDLEARLLANR